MTYPSYPVKMPADLAKVSNGKLGPCNLTPVFVAGVGHGSLHPLAKRAWDALAATLLKDTGRVLTATSVADLYRSYEQQLAVFQKRYVRGWNPLICTTADSRVFDGVRWYKRRGVAAVATPGRSNHGWGLAVDMALWAPKTSPKPLPIAGDRTVWSWMLANAPRFGWSWQNQSESWHLGYFAGDAVPAAVVAFEESLQQTVA